MAKILQETRFTVAANEVLEMRGAAGEEFSCTSGEIWITAEGKPDDVILGPGDAWRAPDNAKLVVSAFKPAVLLRRKPDERMRSSRWQLLAA